MKALEKCASGSMTIGAHFLNETLITLVTERGLRHALKIRKPLQSDSSKMEEAALEYLS